MIYPAKVRARGFTLLEIIIALFILMLVLGTAATATRGMFVNEDLRKMNRQLQILAKTARMQASQQGQSWEIVFKPGLWVLQPVHSADPGKENRARVEYSPPSPLQWKIKTWGNTVWETPKEVSWIFTPAGLCAPNRFRLENGPSWVEISFNPLTANVQEEEFYLP